MAVPADNGLARQRDAEFGSDDMHDTLFRTIDVVKRNIELTAVFRQCFHLLRGNQIGDG